MNSRRPPGLAVVFFAQMLGVNGFALALPNALAGMLSIFLIYKLERRTFER